MKPHRTRFFAIPAIAAAAAMVLAACSSSGNSNASGGSSSSSSSKSPILIGTSLSLTGDFSADGQAFQRGYQLWQDYVNSHGGLLGRQVKMVFLNDQSSPTTVATNYTKLIASDKVALTFGPFSTLLTVPAAKVAARYGYAFPEGAGGGPSVYRSACPTSSTRARRSPTSWCRSPTGWSRCPPASAPRRPRTRRRTTRSRTR